MSSERAGVHTGGALNREKARDVVIDVWDDGNSVGLDGWAGVGAGRAMADPEAESALKRAVDKAVDALEACVVPGPRIEDSAAYKAGVRAVLDRARAEAGSHGLVSVRGLEDEFKDTK